MASRHVQMDAVTSAAVRNAIADSLKRGELRELPPCPPRLQQLIDALRLQERQSPDLS
jgi:hypothetical protein